MQNDQKESYLSELLDSTEDYIWSVDVDFRVVSFNRAVARSFEDHYGRPLSAGKRHDEQLPPDLGAKWITLYRRAISEGRFTVEFIFDDGRTRDLCFNQIVMDGKITGISVFGKDVTQRRAEERARLHAVGMYREIFNGALEGIFQTSSDGQLLTANPAIAKMLGYTSPEELTQAVPDARDVWADPLQLAAYYHRLGEANVIRQFEALFKRKDGTPIWVSLNSRKALSVDGETPIIEGFIVDITDRKLAELQILERDNKLKEAESVAHLGHSTWDAESDITAWSEELYTITGWDPNKSPPGHLDRAKIYTPESWQRLDAAVKQSMATGDPWDLELQIERRDGALRWTRARGFAGRDPSGKVTRLFGTLQDITEQKLSEAKLRDSEERFRSTFEQAAVGIVHCSFFGKILRCNSRFARFLGYSADDLISKTFQELTAPEFVPESNDMIRELATGKVDEASWEKQYLRKDGSRVWARLTSSIQRDGKGEPLHLVTFVEDISARKAAEEHLSAAAGKLRQSETRYRTVFQTSLDALNISRLSDGRIVEVNKTFLDLTGFERDEVIGKTTVELGIWANPMDRSAIVEEMTRSSRIRDVEVPFRRKTSELFWGLSSATVMDIEGVPHVLVATRDITDAKEAIKTIRDLSFYDPLTHLPNRRSVLDLLAQSQSPHAYARALLCVDLDNFTSLNEALGHYSGDHLLQQAAQRITACVLGAGTVARLGSDDFAVVLERLSREPAEAAKQAKQIGETILDAGRHPYLLDERECHCSMSIGITVFGGERNESSAALQQSEIAMFKAKEAGGNTIRFFSPELQANVYARVQIETELRKAIQAEEFDVHFQPQVDGTRLIGCEALVRWNHPDRGLLAPGAFISIAEETGLILPLDDWVMRKSCEYMAAWATNNLLGEIHVSVNKSARQLSQPDFVERVLALLDLTGANPANLLIELTESSLVNDFESTVAKMTQLKSHGVRFSIDDFGTGYSSLAYLRALPLDELKIDRAFVKDILVDRPSRAIAQAIISMGHSMGLVVIAEGVEREDQRDFLSSMGCHSFQGYLFGRPSPADEFQRTWLQ
ncbi:MAG: PAS domain S-box protein [Capsulimonadaceae bacterium]